MKKTWTCSKCGTSITVHCGGMQALSLRVALHQQAHRTRTQVGA